MARAVMLGNGSLTVGLNEHGLVNDFYYPYVGLDNLATSRSVHHKIGVWVDGNFSWVGEEGWRTEVTFESEAMISDIHMFKDDIGLELIFNDFVDCDFNAFCRRITVQNHSDDYHNIRLFMHQVFQISRAGRADTALFVPEENYILDYKGRCSLLIFGRNFDGSPYDQFSIGNYGIEGKEGTYRDAEDGELSNNPVEHGGVDSVLRFSCSLSGGANTQIDYWIVAADGQFSAEKIHHQILSEGIERRMEITRQYWREWLSPAVNIIHTIDKRYQDAIKKSLMVIKVHTDKRGGIIASCDSSIYNFGRDYYSYVWPRDGAYAMWPLIRLGYKEEPKKFFEFCRDILTTDGYLMHKYQPDRAIGSTWHPLIHNNHKELSIQEDETAIVIYVLGEYYERTGDHDFVFSLYNTLIQPAANFMSEFIDPQTQLPHASYDLWEEKFLTTTYTTAIVYQSLLVAADLAEKFEYPDDAVKWRNRAASIIDNSKVFFDTHRGILRRGFLLQEDGSLKFDGTLDVASFYAVMMFASEDIDAEPVQQTLKVIEEELLDKCPAGGIPRYENDHYFEVDPQYKGNPWVISTLWMAQYYNKAKLIDKSKRYVDWALDRALPSGMLSEQINPNNGAPISVNPLVWSHAELLNSVLDMFRLK